MMTRQYCRVLICCLSLGIAAGAWAGDSVMQTAGKVLQIGVGARQVAMGEAMTAATDDVYSLYWNPAGLEQLRAAEISYMHNLWLVSVQDAFLCYAQPWLQGGVGVGINYINFGEFEKYDVENGYPKPLNEKFTPYTLIITAGYGGGLLSSLDVGGSVKLISESADTFNAITLAADLGMQMELFEGFKGGLLIQNLGIPIEGYRLPLSVHAGLAYRIPLLINEKTDRFLVVGDVNVPIPTDQPFYTNLGLEYWYLGMVAMRVGYKLSENNTNLGGAAGVTAGFGVRYANTTLDYAIAPYGELGLTHRLSLTYAFEATKKGKKGKLKKRKITSKYSPATQGGGDESGEMIVPSLSKLTMRKPIELAVNSNLSPIDKTRIEKVMFEIEVKSDKTVQKWRLHILDAKGNQVETFSAEGVPPNKLEWNGKSHGGIVVAESIFCTYGLDIIFQDGSIESLSGKVYEESAEKIRENQTQEADQVKLSSIMFEASSSDLTEAATKYLKTVADKLQSKPFIKLMVEGYTDAAEEEAQAFLLSQKRVDSVVRYLTASYKIPLKNISGHPRGIKNPVASNQTEEGCKQNRRVELTIIYKQ